MSKKSNNTTSSGISLFGAMFIVFLILKLTGNITWSWWWVTAPLWGGFVGTVAVLILIGLPITIYKAMKL